MALTPKQQRFVEEYVVDLNATQAAARAGYSVKTAAAIGAENLRKPQIAAAIQSAKAARSERTRVTADRVVEELARVALSDMRQLVAWNSQAVTLADSSAISDAAAAAVESVSQTTTLGGGSIRIKLHPKVPALKLLGEHLGVFKERTPLEILLDALPPGFAGPLREALGRHAAGG